MAKVMRKGKDWRKPVEKVIHSSPLRVNIPAGMANPKPPLGSQLAQVKRFYI